MIVEEVEEVEMKMPIYTLIRLAPLKGIIAPLTEVSVRFHRSQLNFHNSLLSEGFFIPSCTST